MQEIAGGVTAVDGFSAAGMSAGIKKNGRPDLALLFSESPCTVAGVFTKNRFQAAPILLSRSRLRGKRGQALIVNSGNANAFTGRRGAEDAEAMAALTGEVLGISARSVYVASTGVIGEFLPMDKIKNSIPPLAAQLSHEGGRSAAEAIMTTDTFQKEIGYGGEVGRNEVRIGGMAKGSGMIHPNMATMLAFLTTDVAIDARLLQDGLSRAVRHSFNAITVDGDTSTNDMVLCFASGRSGRPIRTEGKSYRQFLALLEAACLSLAKLIVKDGEGATKFIEIEVEGAPSDLAADQIGKTIAGSSLVKTAFFGEDANWGRIVAAIGNAGVPVDPERLDLRFGPIALIKGGSHQGKEAEEQVAALLKQRDIQVALHLHSGKGKAVVWTSDLSFDYIKINASYRS